ncbi:CdiA C-terminal domain-containing protein [Micromonospora fluostatini]|uniref:CdiA C-terminal domain-containing protein n=1 Tax=Micromonospora sp. JCM 30529 TaxID=3421643 RepID=UPI003D167302
MENLCADTIAGAGYRIHQNPGAQQVAEARRQNGDVGDPGRNPDYLIEGHVFDCYSPREATATRSVWSAVRKKVDQGQSQRIVINAQDWNGDLTRLQRQFDRWPLPDLKELVVLTRDGEIKQITPRHRGGS